MFFGGFPLNSSLPLNYSLGQEDEKFYSMLAPLIKDSLGGMKTSYKRVESAIEEFRKAATEANDRFALQTHELVTDLTKGKVIDPNRVRNLRFFLSLTEQVGQRYSETVDQLIELEEISAEGKLGEYADLIYAVYAIRMGVLKTVEKKMEIMRREDNHELNIEIALHNQYLKEQTQKMDQAFRFAVFTSQEKKGEQKRRLDERAQRLQEENDLLKLALKEKEIKEKIDHLKQRHLDEVNLLRKQINGL